MTLRCLLLILGLWSAQAMAQSEPADAARAAAELLEQATLSLENADSARDRVRALTETVRAYEAGLAAMRDGLRRATTREAQLTRQLQVREDEIAQLLGVLQTIGIAPSPVLMLHPAGPLGTARSGMILSDVTPALNERAGQLRQDLDEIQTLRLLQENAVQTLQDGLSGVQRARAALSQAIADRTDLPRRFTEDPVRTAILLSSTETLDGFASGLSEIAGDEIVDSGADISASKGSLSVPVQGVLLHEFGEADAAGVVRNGILIASRPRALVTSPTAATLRYRGPLLDLGNVVILEPQTDMLIVLSGMDEVFGEIGQVIPEGTPVGLMGGSDADKDAVISRSGDSAGTGRSETLYIEVREGGSPVDPETWFRTEKDG